MPPVPGVYQFVDADGVVLYVGKAKSLRKRVANYFVDSRLPSKIRVMVRRAVELRHIVTDSETDALLLENSLIKRLQPRYNAMLKDDKTYPWIVIRNEPFPRILSTRQVVRDGSAYFGPYASIGVQKNLLEILHGVFQFRTCKLDLAPDQIARGRYRPCLEFHLGNCRAPCVGKQSVEEYAANVDMARAMLRGELGPIRRSLTAAMKRASAELAFEAAAVYKHRLDLLEGYTSRSVVASSSLGNVDVFALVVDDDAAWCNFVRTVRGSIINSFTVQLSLGAEEDPRVILTTAIQQISEKLQITSHDPAVHTSTPQESSTPPRGGRGAETLSGMSVGNETSSDVSRSAASHNYEQSETLHDFGPEPAVGRKHPRRLQPSAGRGFGPTGSTSPDPSPTSNLAREVIVPFLPETELFEGVKFTVPQRGEKKELLEFAAKNARMYRAEQLKNLEIKDPEKATGRVMEAMQRELHLPRQPRWIECFDNSNLQGTNAVAACVVFRDGKPSRREYRHFNVKTVDGPDDYASMREIVRRRYTRLLAETQTEHIPAEDSDPSFAETRQSIADIESSTSPSKGKIEPGEIFAPRVGAAACERADARKGAENILPDLIVVDGGKGQLSAAYGVLTELGIVDQVPIIGLAERLEEVFFPHDPNPYYLKKTGEPLRVLMHIRDEAHRFGITHHRAKRSANFIHSELENIPGIGPKSISDLLGHFKTVKAVRQASIEQLSPIVGHAKAKAIRNFFSKEQKSDASGETLSPPPGVAED